MLPTDHDDAAIAADEVDAVELEEPLEVRPPVESRQSRRRMGRLRLALLLALAVAAGFAVGVTIQKDQGTSSGANPSGASGAAGFPSRSGAATGGGGGTGGAAGGFGGGTAGQVKLIDGTSLYITDAQGNTVKIATSGATISKSAPAPISDLAIGDTVIVQGTTGTDGTVAATSITDSGAGGGLGSAGLPGGAAAGNGRGSAQAQPQSQG